MTKQIARLLLLAQAASDEGKGKTLLSSLIVENKTRALAEDGYSEKDIAIMELVQLLSRYPQRIAIFMCARTHKKWHTTSCTSMWCLTVDAAK